MSEMLWIAVPGGIRQGGALLRVLVVPRLDGGSLGEHGMAQWPPIALRQGTVRVEVHGPGAGSDTSPVLVRDLTPEIPFQSGLWARLVDGLTVEDARELRGAPHGPLTVHPTSRDAEAISRTLRTTSQANVTMELGAQSPDFVTAVCGALADDHWSAAEARFTSRATTAPPPPASPEPAGFHRTLSMLREHPAVLRALGLILELRLDANALSVLAGGTVRVLWPGRPEPLPSVVSPRTRFGAEFLPGSTANLEAGMVRLDRLGVGGARRWEVVTVDVDVAAQRLREAARAVTDRPGEPATLPALRSGGLQLILRGRGQEMLARMARAARAQGAQPGVLTAEDLALGYRIDVLPQLGGGDWFSLQRRRATFRVHTRLADGGISEAFTLVGSAWTPEEGHIKTNAAVHDDSGLHVDEIVATWRGWSLALPRPSFEQATRSAPPARPAMNVTMSFEVAPGSLPRLRFGRSYTMRARVADIAGGGLGPGDPIPDGYRTPTVFYGRHEPVLAPDVALPDGVDPARLDPGESVGHVVVRSDPTAGLDISAYATRFGYRLDDERLLLAPRTTQVIAEQHGMFDDVAPRRSWDWARRAAEDGLPDPAAGGIAVAEGRPGAPAILPRNWDGQWPELLPRILHLTSGPPGRPQAGWEDGRLVVRLAPAEQLTLQLSSFPKQGIIDEFALHDADPPAGSMDAARQGRHPMLTPARTVTFVHAVQRPLRAPDTVLTAHREPGRTIATLSPRTPVLDPMSTAQLDVTACWREHEDGAVHEVNATPVTSITVDAAGSPHPATLFRHEFGDTRHRTVTYTLRAVSRFRPYFRGSDPVAFTRTSTLPPVTVLSTARPVPPVVLSASPAFAWKHTGDLDAPGSVLTRQRLGGHVRLTLQAPWYTTGEGESLAVLVRPDGDRSSALDDLVSQAGHDPICPSFGYRGGGPFARDITSGTGEERTLPVADAAVDVVVKPHIPVRQGEGCWQCDVGVTPAFAHTFLQFAVARYQPHSLDGLWLSDVIRTDLVPLLPERTLRVTRRTGKFEVKLIGPVLAAKPAGRVDMILERCRRPAGMPAEQVDLIAFDDAPDGVPAWVPSRVSSPLPKAAGLPPLKQWTSAFAVAPGAGLFRVRVREVELIPATAAQPDADPHSGTPNEIKERTVFTEIVPLPAI